MCFKDSAPGQHRLFVEKCCKTKHVSVAMFWNSTFISSAMNPLFFFILNFYSYYTIILIFETIITFSDWDSNWDFRLLQDVSFFCVNISTNKMICIFLKTPIFWIWIVNFVSHQCLLHSILRYNFWMYMLLVLLLFCFIARLQSYKTACVTCRFATCPILKRVYKHI